MDGVGESITGVKQLKKKQGAKQAERFTSPGGGEGGGGRGRGFFFFFSPNILIGRELYQYVSKVYFILGISRTDLWSHIVFSKHRG